MKTFWFALPFFFLLISCGQNPDAVYSTPSGGKYHLRTCRIVQGKALREWPQKSEAAKYGLEPCQNCKP